MATIHITRLPSGDLRPIGEESRDFCRRFQSGEIITAEIKKTRNVKHHRKFMALCQVVAEYHTVFDNTEKSMVAIKVAAGHCNWQPNPLTGELMAVPKSISFAAMDQLAFDQFYQNAVQGVLSHILPQLDERSIEAAVNEVISF